MTDWSLGVMPNVGQNVLNAYQQGREMRRQEDTRNALAAYATNPNEQSLNALAPVAPEFVIQQRQAMAKQQLDQRAAQQKQHQEQIGVVGRLLSNVRDEQTYQQALAAARQGGLDLTDVPQTYDPQYVSQTLMLVNAYNKDGGQTLTTTMKELQALGYQPGTPEFQAELAKAINAGYAKPYTDASGATRLHTPQIAVPAPAGAPAVGTIEDGHRFKGGNPADPSAWEPVEQAQPQMFVTTRELDALVRKFGPDEVQRRLDSGVVAVRN